MNGGALVVHSLRRVRVLLVVVSLVLAGFQWLITLAARTLESMNAFTQIMGFLPPSFRVLAGPALVPLMSFGGMVTVGYFHLIVLAALLALVIGVGTEVAGEIELKLVDLLLSRPLWRGWLVIRSIAVLGVSIVAVLTAMAVGTWSALLLFGPRELPWPEPRLIASLAVNLAAMMAAWGAIAMAIAATSRRRVVAGSIAGVAALASFLVDYTARLWEPLARIAWISPFHYMNQLELLTGTPLPLGDVAVLLGVAVLAAAIAFVAVLRRDF